MSSIAPQAEAAISLPAARPSFFGIINGEIYKVMRMGGVWICFYLILILICLPNILNITVGSDIQDLPTAQKIGDLFTQVTLNLMVVRIFIGFFLIILVANVYGREYQLGTVRILLARGVGRLQLFFGKLGAVVVLAVLALLASLLLSIIWTGAYLLVKYGNLDLLSNLTTLFWQSVGLYALTVLISSGVTILMTVFVASLGRSLAFALTIGIAWFPADNILPTILQVAYMFTQNEFWLNATQYFLGPNLNYMADAVINNEEFSILSISTTNPMYIANGEPVLVNGTHTLLVALVYAIVFLVIAAFVTARRDVRE